MGKQVIGDPAWSFLRSVFEGFVGGLAADVKAGRADAAKEHLSKLAMPWNALKFYGGYVAGFAIGLVSPITDLVKGVIGIAKLSISALEWLVKWSPAGIAVSPERQARIGRLVQRFLGLSVAFDEALTGFLKDPAGTARKLGGFLDNLMRLALGKAREIGGQAAHAMFDFLDRDFFDMGRGIGEVIGTVVAQILLLVISDAIGNLIAKGASLLGEAAEFAAGKAVQLFQWIKGFVIAIGTELQNAIKGGLKLFEGLANQALELIREFAGLFAESEALAGPEAALAGGGRSAAGPLPNVMESRMIRPDKAIGTTVKDLQTPKIHPSNVGKEALEPNRISPLAKDSVALKYRENLMERFPKLKQAELTPIKRNLAEPGLFEESAYTGSGERSWSAKMRDGSRIQIDDIDQAGVVVDTKMRGLRSGLEIPPEVEPDLVTQMGTSAPRRSYPAFPEKEQTQLLKQLQFAEENGLTGVRWETNDVVLLRDVRRYRSTMLTDAEQAMLDVVLIAR
ncbi:MAG TPA: hypothetical protein VGC09_11070 [Rhodopila sp.]